MKNLILVRHGKSSYENFTTDKNREISKTGIERTIKIALKSSSFVTSDFVFWSSSAKRAANTASIFAANLPFTKPTIVYKDNLYTFNSADLKSCIRTISDTINKMILFGHNPALTDFLNECTNLQIDNLPTSGLISIEFDTETWTNLPKGNILKTLFAKDL